MAQTVHVFLESNIAAGKSSVIDVLKQWRKDWQFRPEPVELWKNWNGENLLEAYYLEPERNAFKFQKAVIESFAASYAESTEPTVYVWERSLRSAINVFTRLSFEMGYLTHQRRAQLKEMASIACEGMQESNTITIYLRSDPMECFNRLYARARPEEKDKISLYYLQDVHAFHEEEFSREIRIDESFIKKSICEKAERVIEIVEKYRASA